MKKIKTISKKSFSLFDGVRLDRVKLGYIKLMLGEKILKNRINNL